MNKKLSVLLTVIVLLSLVTIAACTSTTDDEDADGIWEYMPDFPSMYMHDFDGYEGDKAFFAVPYDSKWTGAFTGTSMDFGLGIMHVEGPMLFVDVTSFAEVEACGTVGGLELDVLGDRPDPSADWIGTWVITNGTGDLADLQGHGTFWGPGYLMDKPDDYGVIYYAVDEMDLDGVKCDS